MEKEQYLNDLKDIKDIMNRSSRFISLSGMAGVACGLIALVGAYFYYSQVYRVMTLDMATLVAPLAFKAFLIAGLTLFLALASALFFTIRTSRKNKLKLWDTRIQQMLTRFAVPLVTGGLLCLIVSYYGFTFLSLPITLIFYGLGAYAASHFSYAELRSLGIVNIVLGLLALVFLKYALIFWALGFGVLNIVYGIVVHKKYES